MVFSTYVEVIPDTTQLLLMLTGFLHVCGGDPDGTANSGEASAFSPRMWRWSCDYDSYSPTSCVFSTYVEVILSGMYFWHVNRRFLHVCGGDPNMSIFHGTAILFSPRMWRWSWYWWYSAGGAGVFSTYVEVILLQNTSVPVRASFLHVCGGDLGKSFIRRK